MKPMHDAAAEDRRAALHLMQFGDLPTVTSQQSNFQPSRPIESSTIWLSTFAAALIVITINVFAPAPTPEPARGDPHTAHKTV